MCIANSNLVLVTAYPADDYMFIVNNRNTRRKCGGIC